MTASNEPPHQETAWHERSRVRLFGLAVIFAILIAFIAWWFLFRAYVSTNDSRVMTDIYRVVPVGVGGTIEKVLVEEGAPVKKNQVLAEIDHRGAEAQHKKAQARYDLTKNELERAQNLFKKNVASSKDYDNAKSNFEVAQADLKLAELNLKIRT